MATYKAELDLILKEAGRIILEHRDKKDKIGSKENNEIVTPADIEANTYIARKLKEIFPDIPVYTEEGATDKSEATTRWIVDPLDGTTPWVWGNSGFSISIALEVEGNIQVGAVYDPVMEELYYAEKGSGATKNENAISPSICDVSEAFMVVDWGNKFEKRKEGLHYFSKFMLPKMFARRIVPQFAPALGLCRIAEGRIHALVCNDTWVEDHSAGALILREAGGYCSNFYEQKRFTHRQPGIIATSNIETHDAICKLLNS
jgi:myo-inositol-1(or 4)-monophosphatase